MVADQNGGFAICTKMQPLQLKQNWCQSRKIKYSKRIFDFVIFLDWHQNNSFVAKINVFVCFPWRNMSCCLLFVKASVVQVSHYNERKLPQNQMKQCAIGTHTVSSFQISQKIIWKLVDIILFDFRIETKLAGLINLVLFAFFVFFISLFQNS